MHTESYLGGITDRTINHIFFKISTQMKSKLMRVYWNHQEQHCKLNALSGVVCMSVPVTIKNMGEISQKPRDICHLTSTGTWVHDTISYLNQRKERDQIHLDIMLRYSGKSICSSSNMLVYEITWYCAKGRRRGDS